MKPYQPEAQIERKASSAKEAEDANPFLQPCALSGAMMTSCPRCSGYFLEEEVFDGNHWVNVRRCVNCGFYRFVERSLLWP